MLEPRGHSGPASLPTLSLGQETPLLPDHLLHPRSAHSSPRRPFYYKGRLTHSLLPKNPPLPGPDAGQSSTPTNTCLTSGFSPRPSVT